MGWLGWMVEDGKGGWAMARKLDWGGRESIEREAAEQRGAWQKAGGPGFWGYLRDAWNCQYRRVGRHQRPPVILAGVGDARRGIRWGCVRVGFQLTVVGLFFLVLAAGTKLGAVGFVVGAVVAFFGLFMAHGLVAAGFRRREMGRRSGVSDEGFLRELLEGEGGLELPTRFVGRARNALAAGFGMPTELLRASDDVETLEWMMERPLADELIDTITMAEVSSPVRNRARGKLEEATTVRETVAALCELLARCEGGEGDLD